MRKTSFYGLCGVICHFMFACAAGWTVGEMAWAEDAPAPALQAGHVAPAFRVKDLTGPNAGQVLCYRSAFEKRPVICIFARELNDDLARLLRQLNAEVAREAKGKQLRAMVVYLPADAAKATTAENDAKDYAQQHELQYVPITLFERAAGPGGYDIWAKAQVTAIGWNAYEIRASRAFGSAGLAIPKTVEGKSPASDPVEEVLAMLPIVLADAVPEKTPAVELNEPSPVK